MTKLPLLGVVGDIHLVFPHGRNISEFVDLHCPHGVHVKGMTILISDLESLETWTIAAAMQRILGSHAFHHITGGEMRLVESVLVGTYYGWAQMMLLLVK